MAGEGSHVDEAARYTHAMNFHRRYRS